MLLFFYPGILLVKDTNLRNGDKRPPIVKDKVCENVFFFRRFVALLSLKKVKLTKYICDSHKDDTANITATVGSDEITTIDE